MTFQELKNSKELAEIDYFDLLKCDEWKIKREEILERDNYRCNKCLKSRTINSKVVDNKRIYTYEINGEAYETDSYINMQIHHTLYIYNKLPWDYNQKYLTTLCNHCHQKLHNDSTVNIWDQNELHKMEFGHCDRCAGKGHLPQYRKIQNGICFKCQGFGYNSRLINLEEL
jgi:hypothetical protein